MLGGSRRRGEPCSAGSNPPPWPQRRRPVRRNLAMLTKFDTSYVGSIDLENPGYTGTPINSRRYSSAELAAVMQKTEAYAQQLDKLGYNAFWMAEHHFQP